ncbi:MAG: NAD(P)H-dependent oxidoreductase subunit E [Proteobacteria bacterium]|nr:NAD(P)H-dependent oxidoreductase subunit E [Pseudomonadota bacterium]NIS70877.1 NAD(P)H-dependent oxidoreductase subunit E [Pseudomonadota bacterium]
MDVNPVETILKRYDYQDSWLVAMLQDLQTEMHYLPKEALEYMAEKLGISRTRIFRVATFYAAFSLTPKGKHRIHVCLGTACHVRGAGLIVNTLERQLKIKPGGTTSDLQFSLDTVNCLGACASGPIVVVDGEYSGEMSSLKMEKLLKPYRKGKKES